jgi:hypothetical protein
MSLGIKILPEPLRTLEFDSISGTYAPMGAFSHPIRIIHITNTTDVLLTFSFNGVTNHFVVPSGSFILLDITANKTSRGEGFFIGEGTTIYVMGSPTLGAVYLASFYGYDII